MTIRCRKRLFVTHVRPTLPVFATAQNVLMWSTQLTLARWTNLAGIPFLLNDHLGTLTDDNLELVANVLWLNVIVPPALRLLDVRGR